ncbi:quinolinate synthase NadA [Texcoconibacillus texcoconensis]|uniref:Quinolinate synthase n=1 Tax=Texcoconibacillus texcoconensis TaxID=1095777 RepID=A0A840QSC2_9BACI|nr:quinolinate synthase NadA [Texcoconibacillus texcoconensis]MBB5174265.1 quinolinate synthase [Texcoconibacillus texcoconensis]
MSILHELEAKTSMMPEEYKHLSTDALIKRAKRVKEKLGDRLFIPGHHYQKDEVIQFADATGDSLQLAKMSSQMSQAEYIVFCGVHFMAETADMLTRADQTVVLPDMRAGCSMADMADIKQAERAWEKLTAQFGDTIIPLTYVNSTAEIKAFVAERGGATVTSSNAKKVLQWAFNQKERILFLPDQHLGRNTAYDLGIPLEQMTVWDPISETLSSSGEEDKRMILWKGHCSVHEMFTIEHVRQLRESEPERKILVHPECTFDVVQASDQSGSTSTIIKSVREAAPGTKWAIGTEMNLVERIRHEHPEQDIVSLNPNMCPCVTMNRIDLPHFVWSLERIEAGSANNTIRVDKDVSSKAVQAIERMFEISS